MPRYTVKATGRRLGAIGIAHPISVDVDADSPEAAILRAYDTYEHLSNVEVLEICPNCGQWRRNAGDCLNQCAARGFAD